MRRTMESERAPHEKMLVGDTTGEEILVVEDSSTQALYLEGVLERTGYRISVVRDGQQALEYLADHQPTLVISDIVMPGMDGYELCRRIKGDERLKEIPVILVTFLSDPTDILKGLECGADNFITKPFNDSMLVSRIQYLLINREMRQHSAAGIGLEVYFGGKSHYLTAERLQIVDLLLTSFETTVANKLELEQANKKLREANQRLKEEIAERKRAEDEKHNLIVELQKALAEVKNLSGMLPICSSCKRVRDDKGYWQQIEAYIRDHSDADFSHGICPECAKKFYPDLYDVYEE